MFLAVLMVALSAWSQLLWRVSGNGLEKPSFLMGTHHFAPADFIDSVSGLNDAIRSCDAVYGEIHRDSMMNIQAQQRVAMAMVAPADSTLDKVLTPEQYAVVKSVVDGYLAPAGITLASLNMLKPAGVSIQLQALQALKYFKDFDHNKQIDRSVQNRGEQAGKTLGGFETVDDQVAILFGTPIVDQAEGLVDVCEHDADFERVSIELAEAYMRAGKTSEALEALNTVRARSNANPASSIDIQVILDERERELLLEEDRWATLLRNKPEEWQKRIMDYATYTASGSAKKYPEVRRWSEFQGPIQFKNWPIPQTYIDLNTGAEFPQNPGW